MIITLAEIFPGIKCSRHLGEPAGTTDRKTITIGTFNNSGFRNFSPVSEGDRVLVIDNASAKLLAPGNQKSAGV